MPPVGLMGRINSGIEMDFDHIARAEAMETDGEDYEGVENVRGELDVDIQPD